MWYLILSRRQPDISHAKMVIHEHFKWMQARHAAGDVLFSGPKPDRTMGIYVIQAASVAAATAIADSDPLHVSGRRWSSFGPHRPKGTVLGGMCQNRWFNLTNAILSRTALKGRCWAGCVRAAGLT